MASCRGHGPDDLESVEENIKKQNEPTEKKRERHLEMFSITCTTVGINLVVACFCGVPNSFGLESPDVIFKCAFAFLLTSTFLGILAMISSIKGYEFLQIPIFSTLKHSLFYGLLKMSHSPRGKDIQSVIKTEAEVSKIRFATAEISYKPGKIRVTPECLDDMVRTNPEDNGFSRESLGQRFLLQLKTKRQRGSTALPNTSDKPMINSDLVPSRADRNQYPLITASGANENSPPTPKYSGNSLLLREYGLSTRQLEQPSAFSQKFSKQRRLKNVLQLKKRKNTIFFGQVIASRSSGITRGPISHSCEAETDNNNACLVPFLQGNIMSEPGGVKEQFYSRNQPSETSVRLLPVGVGVGNSRFEAESNYNFHHNFLRSSARFQAAPRDQVLDVTLKLNEMNFVS